MVPLKTNRHVLTWLCLYQNDEKLQKREKLKHYTFALVHFALNVIGFTASATYFVKFVIGNFEESLFALAQSFGEANMIYITIINFMLRQKITNIFKAISSIHNDCKRIHFEFQQNYSSRFKFFHLLQMQKHLNCDF